MSNPVKPGYVYLFHAVGSGDGSGFERYKIGLTTRHVDDRLKELNSGQSPFWLVEVGSIKVSDCEAAEAALHEHFHPRRLFIDTDTGETGYYDDIPAESRKSTEWFVFDFVDMLAVKQSYDRVQKQYPWQMLPPNLRQKPDRDNQQQNDRQWQYTVSQVVDEGRSSSSGGWGWLIAGLIAIALIPLAQGMGRFANAVNGAENQTRSPVNLDPVGDFVKVVLSPFNQTQTIAQSVTVKQLANARDRNPRGGKPIVSGQTIPAGTTLSV
ncbi:MAG: GIY-YIG nuclease family protein, partial [Casimicrobium sp.]